MLAIVIPYYKLAFFESTLMSLISQTDKRFNDVPFPIQNIGENGKPTLFETPMLIQKNTSVNISLTSWVEDNVTSIGSGVHEFFFFGLKVRNEESLKLIQTMFF